VNFEPTLIQQMLAELKSKQPTVLVVISTPVAQAAKKIKAIPVVFSDVTDPLEADVLKEESKSFANVTGASDRQDLYNFLKFAKILLPQAKRIGVLYALAKPMMQRSSK
jgi:putative ABC transport system substrate-binding protein